MPAISISALLCFQVSRSLEQQPKKDTKKKKNQCSS
uniref:Uncharacterized protein n=1 Tax=Rhizophora mucronata TaxID=61149 RepID=A0A2P2PH39_RHIMU